MRGACITAHHIVENLFLLRFFKSEWRLYPCTPLQCEFKFLRHAVTDPSRHAHPNSALQVCKQCCAAEAGVMSSPEKCHVQENEEGECHVQ